MVVLFLVVTILNSIVTIYISKHKLGFWLNHYTLHNLFWLGTVFLAKYASSFQVPVNDTVYIIFLIGLWAFNSTVFFLSPQSALGIRQVSLSLSRRRLIEMLVLVSILPQAYLNFKLIRQGVNLWEINLEFWGSRGSGSYLYALYQESVVTPLSKLLIATSFYYEYYDKKNTSGYVTIIIALIIGLASLFTTGGGRTGVLHLLFMFLLSYAAVKNIYLSKTIVKINPIYIATGIILCVSGIAWATIQRGHDSMVSEIIDRYTLCVPLFEYYYNSPILDTHTYGASMFEFIWTLITYPFRALGADIDIVRNNSIIQEFVYLPALSRSVNAYPTEYFNYIRDFGVTGIILGPCILASLYNWAYKFFKKNTFYMLFFVAGVLSWNFESHFAFLRNNCLSIIYCVILYHYLRPQLR